MTGGFSKELKAKGTLVGFRKNTSLMVKKSLLVFLKKTKKHYYVKKKQI